MTDLQRARFRFERKLGEGGMGEVWLATDTLLERAVAIKYPLVTSPLSVDQLLQEARLLAPLNHPNITLLHDFLVDQDHSRFYLVMEYVDGKSLSAIIEDGHRLPLEISLEIAQGVLRALSYAHKQGVVHRDVKPDNVMIADDVKLNDFGLAKLAALLQRGTDLMAGTPLYMAPEQIEGRPTDGRADLYSLGVMLFELLSGGHLPFEFTDEAELLEAHLHTPPPPLSQLVPDIPPVLEQIIRRLLAKDPEGRYPSAEAVLDVLEALHVGPKFSNLPVPLTPFIGQEAELAELKDRLQDPACRLLTLVGPGGSGKTRLALEAAAAEIDNFAHGVFFVSLAPLDSVDSIVPTVAEALGFRFYEEAEPQQQLLDYLRQKRMLLVFDNFEHLVVGAGLVTEILQIASEVKILATSRARLNIQGEHPFPIDGMSFPDREVQEDATQYSAVRLFLSRVRRTQPRYEPSTNDLTDIARVCHLVAGMPLGILLAAARVEMLTPAEIAAEIRQSLDFLETDLRDLPARQQSMRAVFDHSWKLLTEREREVFQGLSVFRGGFTRQASQAVTGASLQELIALVNKSGLHRMSTGRYDVHELMRQYAAEKLDQVPAASEVARDRHSVYYCAALQQWGEDLKGPRQQTALVEMDVEIENARAAWDWAVERGQVERLDQSIEGLGLFYEWRGRYQEGEAACRLAADKLEAVASGDGLRVLAKVLAWQSMFSDRTRANQLLQQSLLFLERPELADQDIRAENAFVLRQMGSVVYEYDNDLQKAKQLWEQSLALYQALGDQWGMANTLADLGAAVRSLGIYGEAKQLQEESLAIRQALGDQEGIADSLDMLSAIARGQGQLEEAERLVRESVVIRSKTGDQQAIANAHLDLGITLVFVGKFAEAHSLMEESLASYSDLRDRGKAWLNGALGYAEVHLGRYKQARAQGQLGLSLAREIGYRYAIGATLQILGWVALAGEAYAEAQSFLQESVTVRRESGQRYELGVAFASLGYAARGLGNIPQAEQHLSEALTTTTDTGIFWPFIYALPAMALLLADHGQKERAVELYALASRYGFVANSRWFEDVAGRHVAAVAATLQPEVVTAAQEQGKSRDLWTTAEELLAELGQA